MAGYREPGSRIIEAECRFRKIKTSRKKGKPVGEGKREPVPVEEKERQNASIGREQTNNNERSKKKKKSSARGGHRGRKKKITERGRLQKTIKKLGGDFHVGPRKKCTGEVELGERDWKNTVNGGGKC